MSKHLLKLLDRKFYKTGQTRGADDDEIYQNRVNRNNTVLIPYNYYEKVKFYPYGNSEYENGYIVLISPEKYFTNKNSIEAQGLKLGINLLIFYETREQWASYNPEKYGFKYATSRQKPLGGEYVARIPATTSIENANKISLGYNEKTLKGAGIRVYEYASSEVIRHCKLQLEAIFWLCYNSEEVLKFFGMDETEIDERKTNILTECNKRGLLDYDKLLKQRIINKDKHTICPLCLKELDAHGFFDKVPQAEGREVVDLTVTQLNLFHIKELRVGEFNHVPYNLGWGHHHCNIVVKDSGIFETLNWMKDVVQRNEGYIKLN